MITIFQIQLTRSQIDAVNAHGWQSSPAAEAYATVSIGAKNFQPRFLEHYTATYEVETDNFEKAFELTNLWHNGHLVRALPGTRGTSSSVGNIFQLNDRFYMVDTFGFQELTLFADEVEILTSRS